MSIGDGNSPQKNVCDDQTLRDAFIALGGHADLSGSVSTDRLRQAIVEEFALPIDIDKIIAEADVDSSGLVDFHEFCAILRT